MRLLPALILSLIAALALAAPVGAQMTVLPPGFTERNVTGDNFFPVGTAWAPDGRQFVVEKAGRLVVWKPDGTKATVRDYSAEVNSYSDRGFLGVAVDKDFAENNYLYLLYTREQQPLNPDQPTPATGRLERVTISADNKIVDRVPILGTYEGGACPTPSDTVDCIPTDKGWHTIGTVRVDPRDGTLWVGAGDGHEHEIDAASYRPYDERSLAGKIIHIDREGRGLPGHPFCPAEDDLTKVCTKLYAKGLRNPFRFTLRPDGKGLVVGDVGFGQQEELDLVKPGRNYGWPCWEGKVKTALYDQEARCEEEYAKVGPDAPVPPLYSYEHGDGASITGGPELEPGNDYPAAWVGDVFIGDYVRGWIKRVELDEDDELVAVHDFASGGSGVVDLQIEPGGDLAYVDLGYDSGEPQIRRFDYTAADGPPNAVATATPDQGAPPLEVTFSAAGSSEPGGQAMTYAWDFGDGTTGTGIGPVHTYTEEGEYVARLTVTDTDGLEAEDTVTISVGANAAPVATITSPADESTYVGGQPVTLRGSATDAEDGTVPSGSLRWNVILNHAGHTHVEVAGATGPSVTFEPLTDHDADSFYEVTLEATDSAERTGTKVIQLRPETRAITLDSSPPGAPLEWSGESVTAPATRDAAVGYQPTLSAPATFARRGRVYRFVRWSDGGARTHTISVPAEDTSYTAVYEADGLRTLRLPTVADTHVDEANPDHVFGPDVEMVADSGPVRRALLRFAPATIGNDRVVGARLRLLQRDASPDGGVIRGVSDSAWAEEVLWPGPAVDGSQLADFGAVAARRWYEVDLAAGWLTGDGPRSLAIVGTSTDGSKWGTKESQTPPELIVELEEVDDPDPDPTPTPTPTPSATPSPTPTPGATPSPTPGPSPTPSPTPFPEPPGPFPPLVDRTPPRVTVAPASRRPARASRKGVVQLAATVSERAVGTLVLRGPRNKVLGKANFIARPGGPVRVRVKLRTAARKLLALRARKVRADLRVEDPAGNAARATWTFKLRAPRR